MMLLLSVFLLLFIQVIGDDDSGWVLLDNPLVYKHPCKGSTDIRIIYDPGRSPEEENSYNLCVHKKFPKNTVIKIKFDKGATVTLLNQTVARIDLDKSDKHAFSIIFFKSHEGLCLYVQGCTLGVISYIKSFNINTKEYCGEPLMGFLDSYIKGYKLQAQSSCTELEAQEKGTCGKRQTLGMPLIVQGESQRNDWPWHVAVLKNEIGAYLTRYICGGTLISRYHVLTAAHCAFQPGLHGRVLANLTVALGKYNLKQQMELGSEEKEVEKIIIHEHYNNETFFDDIALFKMKTEATFSINIQPACLWNENDNKIFESDSIMGIIVGWGFDDNDSVSNKLIQAQIPMIPHVTCIRNEPSFYSFFLNNNKFCGGILNEALACNGDSGGGFHVFIPDKVDDNSTTGTWHIRGLISLGSIISAGDRTCTGDRYNVYTDVDKYREWILNHM